MGKYFGGLTFEETFVCNPEAPCKEFTSWDDLFTRTLRPNVRTLQLPDSPNIINAAYESDVHKLAREVMDRDTFLLKGGPYSLVHMLNNDPDYAKELEGGTVFQGFLAVTSYHRWHSPVTGTIKKIVQVEGAYFVQSPATLGAKSMLPLYNYLASLGFITLLARLSLSSPKTP